MQDMPNQAQMEMTEHSAALTKPGRVQNEIHILKMKIYQHFTNFE
jgi:hypothetical protein